MQTRPTHLRFLPLRFNEAASWVSTQAAVAICSGVGPDEAEAEADSGGLPTVGVDMGVWE
jgi:hypothetical protein